MDCKECKYREDIPFTYKEETTIYQYCTACMRKGKMTRRLLAEDPKPIRGCVYEVSSDVPAL